MALTNEPLEDVPDWTFGERLRKIRRHRGLTQQQLADLVGVSVNRLSNWEADAHVPRDVVTLARKLEATTGFPADWTLGLRTGSFTTPSEPPQHAPQDMYWAAHHVERGTLHLTAVGAD